MKNNIILERTVQTQGGRNGIATSLDRPFTLPLATPVEMGGTPSENTNPEELLAAGYSACFASSMEFLLRSQQIDYDNVSAISTVRLVPDAKFGGFRFSITITATVSGVDENTKTTIVEQASLFCPYSKALRGNVDVEIVVE